MRKSATDFLYGRLNPNIPGTSSFGIPRYLPFTLIGKFVSGKVRKRPKMREIISVPTENMMAIREFITSALTARGIN